MSRPLPPLVRGLVLALAAGCGGDGTVNNGVPQVALTLRVSALTGPEPDEGAAPEASLSADGRYVAFVSRSTTICPDDTNTTPDVFVQDLWTRTVTLVSRPEGLTAVRANGSSFASSISADGRRVAFISLASNLHPDDPDAIADVFVRDLETQTLTLASRATVGLGTKVPFGGARTVSLSGDGRRVAFSTDSSLDVEDGDTSLDVYVRDLTSDTTFLVSRADGPSGAKANGPTYDPSISHDGSRVAFVSDGTNLTAEPGGYQVVYVRDLAADTTVLVSRADGAAGAPADAEAYMPSISGDGRVVSFASFAMNLDPDDFEFGPDIYLRDLEASTTRLASRASGPAGVKSNNATYDTTRLSFDGRRVVFASDGSNLVPQDGNFTTDVFLRDMSAEVTTRVSVRTFGEEGADWSRFPAISPDGRFVAFFSVATNLVDDDGNLRRDLFVRGPLP